MNKEKLIKDFVESQYNSELIRESSSLLNDPKLVLFDHFFFKQIYLYSKILLI